MADKRTVSAKKTAQPAEVAPITVDGRCLTIHGLDTLIYSGAFHYFRCPKPLWEDRFLKIKRAGFNAVETYIAWNWHERAEGQADLKDLDDWLTMAAKHGLHTIVRAGPYICAEWEGGGHPGWLAGRGIRWRSDSAECLKWSRHWYELVMPVIAKHQVTRGGKLIMVQVENEYEYAAEPPDVKRRYVAALYGMAREMGIDVPVFTCRTPEVWDRSDPAMKAMFDTWTFYPWWEFAGVEKNLEELRAKQPDAPLMVMELQGGWYSEIGGKVLRHTELDGRQIDALTKTCLAHGVTGLNYYMLFGGTHPGHWGFPPATTSYDYAAPLAEPGGLWEKWYSVKLLGDFLGTFGGVLARSEPLTGASVEAPGVTVLARRNGDAVFAFVRNDTDEPKEVRLNLPPEFHRPAVSTSLKPRQCKVFPFTVPLGRLIIERCTAQIQSVYRRGNRWIMLLADEPGSHELSVRIQDSLISSIVSWDATGRMTQVHPRLTVWGQPPDRAARTWTVETAKGPALVSTGAYFLRGAEVGETEMKLAVETLPGEASLRALAPAPNPSLKELRLRTPELPAGPVVPESSAWSAEDLRAGEGWKPGELRPLHELGWHDKGFYRYRAEFEWKGEKGIQVTTLAADHPVVAVNGRMVPMAGSDRLLSGPLEGIARLGRNTIEVLCENRGRTKFGEGMEESKGLSRVELVADWRPERLLERWKYSMAGAEEPADSSAETKPTLDDSGWKDIRLAGGEMEGLFEFRGWLWLRTSIELASPDASASAHLRLEGVRGKLKAWANGRPATVSVRENRASVSLQGMLTSRRNALVIAVEKPWAFSGLWGPVSLGFQAQGRPVEGWEFAPSLARMPGALESGDWTASPPAGATLCWHRSSIRLPAPEGWTIQWKLVLEGQSEARIFLNGEHIGNYYPIGPQKEFYLPECYLKAGADNELAIAVFGGTSAPEIAKLSVEPYREYSVFRHEVRIPL